ncbi:predicted protein [Plenodomus lingam JN3]|uniref:Predicted protein n=1 Tax=Leptosphaeria maculans (strain JN3 / isolate v23.1.3 / race Av1-4-5-6-7-8) TaxID=985895 RepID=E4ZX08_LEPMJ|nr:predicted protein [Plenodomus lingam JN3]CBX95218.1 predicted protein [Plenodomus lingam JN3]
MANVARPPLRQTRLTFSPVVAPNDDAHHHSPNTNNNTTTSANTRNSQLPQKTALSPRRSSRTSPLLALASDAKPVQQLVYTAATAAAPPPTRTPTCTSTPAPAPAPAHTTTNPRKRPATALSSPEPTTDTRPPPTKVTVTQPQSHGDLMRIPNGLGGAAPPVGIGARQGPPTTTTTTTTSQDKRSLRSHDGGSRLKSDLPTYFANYDEVIAGLPQSSDLLDLDTRILIVDEPIKPRIL